MDKKTQIVVVGGGAGGLELVRRLGARFGNRKYDVILLERNGTHVWKPLLHEVAAGSLDANLDEIGYRDHAYRWRYRFFCGSLEGIDRASREVIVAPLLDDDGSELIGRHRIRYDYLVLATGSVTNDFGTPGVAEHCLVLDERSQADRFRQKLLNHCFRVSRAIAADPQHDAYVDVSIVGGGATGVELAAELYNAAAALRYYGLEVFDEKRLRVTLLEAGPRILPALPEKLAEAARHELEALGVKVLVNTSISRVAADGLWAQSGDFHPAHLKVWAAGVKAAELLKGLGGLETNARNQLLVRRTLQTSRDDRIFALGDCCACTLEDGKGLVPPRAQAAHQMASTVFQNICRLVKNAPLESFVYRDHGSLVSLSRFSTVGSLMGNLVGGRMAIEGRLAKFVYTSLYRMHLIAVHGWFKGGFLLAVGRVNKVIRPRMKLH
jgi:NADH dehydrogenase